jgi:hypothetical protein
MSYMLFPMNLLPGSTASRGVEGSSAFIGTIGITTTHTAVRGT